MDTLAKHFGNGINWPSLFDTANPTMANLTTGTILPGDGWVTLIDTTAKGVLSFVYASNSDATFRVTIDGILFEQTAQQIRGLLFSQSTANHGHAAFNTLKVEVSTVSNSVGTIYVWQ